MPVLPFIPAIATVASAGLGVLGASKAAGAAGQAADQNAAMFKEFFGKIEGYMQPYMGRGNDAGGMYMDALMGGPRAASAFDTYKRSAGYESNLAAGVDAITTGKSNQGLLKSGSTLKASQKFGTDLNNSYFQNWIGNLAMPQQLGVQAGQALSSAAGNFAGMNAQNNNNRADATGNAWLYGTSAIGSALKGLGGMNFGGAMGQPSLAGMPNVGGPLTSYIPTVYGG